MVAPSAPWVLLGAGVLAAALAQSMGHFSLKSLTLVTCAASLFGVGLARSRRTQSGFGLPELRVLAWAVAAGCVLVGWVVAPGGKLGGPRFHPFLLLSMHLLATAVVAAYLPDVCGRPVRTEWVRRLRGPGLYLAAGGMGLWMLYTLHAPGIDVFALHQQGAERLLALEPVYGNVAVVDSNTHARVIDDYVYPPLSLVLTTLGYAVSGDSRLGALVAVLLTAVLVQRIARRRLGDDDVLPELLAAALLLQPRAPYVLSQAWGEPLALPFVAGFALLADQRRNVGAAILLGLACATKQYLLVLGAAALWAPGLGLRGALIAGATVVATLLPFALWTPGELWEGLVTHHLDNPFRKDALGFPALAVRFGLPEAPGWLGFLALPIVLLGAARLPRRLDVALGVPLVALTWFFLFGRQAFANYYYFVTSAAFVWVALCVERELSSADA